MSLSTVALASLIMLSAALLLTVVRLLRGPSLPDRVVALDLLSTLGVGMLATGALVAGQGVFLDVAVVIALVSFLGTVAFARYLEKGGTHD